MDRNLLNERSLLYSLEKTKGSRLHVVARAESAEMALPRRPASVPVESGVQLLATASLPVPSHRFRKIRFLGPGNRTRGSAHVYIDKV